ncbi:RNA polymerase sigma factor [Tengunoibacter tsumagoiensis]|uniref:DNA-directed RNA polymerase sigma-70 factor n=1 Tax=Tengunoibacter tsumagoiensis TaxID=2014871 RepID=A0A402A880_9CHLR|nr:sigma-70 family RNA polymerase sigma factor [Tengunoibacter tsumagoiensis]GCE15380.1 hypothetical protein KTT_52390 [Tengunoibacter tsumagoiensis]
MDEFYTLVETAQAGSKEAYESLINQFQQMAYATAYHCLGDYILAQDAVQEALIEAYLHLPQLKEPAAFPGWFRQIVFYQCHRLLRKPSFEHLPLEAIASFDSGADPLQDIAERHEVQAVVQQAIALLPPKQHQIVDLFYLSGYTQQEISSALNLPVNTIKKCLYSARLRLKEHLLPRLQDAIAHTAHAILIYLREGWWEPLFERYSPNLIPGARPYATEDAKQCK